MNKELRSITKALAGTLRQDGTGRVLRRECWEATTVDGEWAFERIEDIGTPWIIVHFPRTPAAETLSHTFGTLKAARQAVESGWAGRELPSVLRAAHAEHTYEHFGCPTCRDERDAAWAARRAAVAR